MYQFYRNYARLALGNMKFCKCLSTKSHLRPSCCYRLLQFRTSSDQHFDHKNTPVELKKKLQKLYTKYQHDLNFTPHSLNGILNHPCFDASHVCKEEGYLLLKSSELMNDEVPEERVRHIWKIWAALQKYNIVDLNSYHLLLLALLRTGVKVDVNHILKSLDSDGFTPTAQIYNLLLRCVSENDNFDEVRAIISEMAEEGHEIDDEGRYAIIYATAKCRGLDHAMEYIRASSSKFNSHVYVSLLRGVAESSDLQSYNRLFTEAQEKGSEFCADDRISIVESLIKGNLISVIPNVLDEKTHWQSNIGVLCNLCVRSMHSGQYVVAKMILNYAEEFLQQHLPIVLIPAPMTYAEYLTTEMIKSKMPLKDILRFCHRNDFIPRIKNATYASLRHRIFDYSLDLFETMKQNDLPVRPHYFWPILLANNGEPSVFGLLSAMKALKVNPDFDTLLNYVYPFVDCSNPVDTLQKLKQIGITDEDSVTPMIAFLLSRYMLSAAIELCDSKRKRKRHGVINYERLYPKIASALVKTKDFESVIEICRNRFHHFLAIFHYVLYNHKDEVDPVVMKKLLNFFIDNKIAIFRADLSELRVYLDKHNMTDVWLDNLLNVVNETPQEGPHLRDMNIEELEKYVVHLKDQHYSLRQALRRLLIMHAQVGNTNRVLELKKELEEKNFKLSIGMKAALIQTFSRNDDFHKAYELFLDLKRNNEHEQLDLANVTNLAIAAAKKGDLEVTYEIFRSRKVRPEDKQRGKIYLSLLKIVTDYHGIEAANKLFNFLVAKNYIQVNIQLLAPIIKEFLSRQDVERAALACLDYGSRYRVLPMRSTILSALASLAVEEKALKKEPKFELLLNKFLQTSCYLYGQKYTNIMYVICLAKTGMLAMLRSYMMESYTGTDEKIVWRECNKLADHNELQTLINLRTAFKDMPLFNMEPIYINLLKIYCRNKDRESAEKLLKSLDDSNHVPSETFLSMYAELQNGDEKT